MLRRLAVLLAGALCLLPALAQGISERPDTAVVTIYHEGTVDTAQLAQQSGNAEVRRGGLAFITETRTIDVPAGESVIELRGVASTIVPQTVEINGLPARMLERNFDYDLLSPGSLLAKSVGNTVKLVRTDEHTGRTSEQTAIVRSAPNGAVLEINGKFEALRCSGLPEKLVFTRIPEGLRDTPTLSIRTRADEAGHYTIKLSYIATGMNWSADYVARLRPDGLLDLAGWLTLANFGDTGFGHVPLEVVAGRLETTGDDKPVDPKRQYLSSGCWPTDINWATMVERFRRMPMAAPAPPPRMAAKAVGAEEMETMVVTGTRASIQAVDLGDYKLYALPEPTDLWARRTKQVQFLDQAAVPYQRVYVFNAGENGPSENSQAATAILKLQNTEEGKLGKPLPAGSVAVYGNDPDGGAKLLGQDRVRDTSVGLPFEVKLGEAMAVRVRDVLTAETTVGDKRHRRTRQSFEVTITNGKREAIAFELRQPVYEGMRVISESQRHAAKPEGDVWAVALAAGEEKVVSYTIELP